MKRYAKVRVHNFMAKDRGKDSHDHCPKVRFKKIMAVPEEMQMRCIHRGGRITSWTGYAGPVRDRRGNQSI